MELDDLKKLNIEDVLSKLGLEAKRGATGWMVPAIIGLAAGAAMTGLAALLLYPDSAAHKGLGERVDEALKADTSATPRGVSDLPTAAIKVLNP